MSARELMLSTLEDDIGTYDTVQDQNFKRRESLIDNLMEKASAMVTQLGAGDQALDPKDVQARLAIIKTAVDLTRTQEDSAARRVRIKVAQREQQTLQNTGQIVAEILTKIGVDTKMTQGERPDFKPGDLESALENIDTSGIKPIADHELYADPTQGIVVT